jgi:hypothetical protein
MNQFTVNVTLQDGFSWTRDLLDQKELTRYISEGVAMHLVDTIQITNNFEEKKSVRNKNFEKNFSKGMYGDSGSVYN